VASTRGRRRRHYARNKRRWWAHRRRRGRPGRSWKNGMMMMKRGKSPAGKGQANSLGPRAASPGVV
jgi:hypothetical protein